MDIVLGLAGLIPFVFLFSCLVLTKIKSYLVSGITLLISAALALFVWKTPAVSVALAALEGSILAIVPIIWVIFAAVFTYLASVKTGAMDTIKIYLVELTPDSNVQAVLITFCLGGFLESVAGFGTAVAIPTAVLITLGHKPVNAAILSLVANSVPVAFGALGIPVIVLSQITGLDLASLTKFTALLLLPFSIFIPLALALISNSGFKGILKSVPDVLVIGITFTCVQTLTAFYVGPELVAVAGSLLSLASFVLIKKITRSAQSSSVKANLLLRAVSGYILLLALVLLTRLVNIPALKASPFIFSIVLGEHTMKIDWLTTPGTLLFISSIVGAFIQGIKPGEILSITADAANKIKASSLTIIAIVALAKVMGYSGIIGAVSVLISNISGRFYPLLAPSLGALGTFVTGSDTSSNILLGSLQKETALKLGLSPEWIASSNTAGATAGKMISPLSISVAASSCGITEKEGEIMKSTLPYCIAYAALMGIYVFIVSIFSQ